MRLCSTREKFSLKILSDKIVSARLVSSFAAAKALASHLGLQLLQLLPYESNGAHAVLHGSCSMGHSKGFFDRTKRGLLR